VLPWIALELLRASWRQRPQKQAQPLERVASYLQPHPLKPGCIALAACSPMRLHSGNFVVRTRLANNTMISTRGIAAIPTYNGTPPRLCLPKTVTGRSINASSLDAVKRQTVLACFQCTGLMGFHFFSCNCRWVFAR